MEGQDRAALQWRPGERRTARAAASRRGRGFGTSVDDFCARIGSFAEGVPFGLEGDAAALRVARQDRARSGRGGLLHFQENRKSAYHAWGAFTSPLLIALLVTGEKVARAAGLSTAEARRKMLPILRQTLANYAKLGPAGAFSGPIVRGDAQVVRQHLRELKKIPGAEEVYVALARAGLRYLPVGNRKELEKLLRSECIRGLCSVPSTLSSGDDRVLRLRDLLREAKLLLRSG